MLIVVAMGYLRVGYLWVAWFMPVDQETVASFISDSRLGACSVHMLQTTIEFALHCMIAKSLWSHSIINNKMRCCLKLWTFLSCGRSA